MNPDRLQISILGADPASARRSCRCRGRGRGQHQGGCPLRGLAQWLRWALGIYGAEALAVAEAMREGGT